jgi:hypothetical protein
MAIYDDSPWQRMITARGENEMAHGNFPVSEELLREVIREAYDGGWTATLKADFRDTHPYILRQIDRLRHAIRQDVAFDEFLFGEAKPEERKQREGARALVRESEVVQDAIANTLNSCVEAALTRQWKAATILARYLVATFESMDARIKE